MPLELQMKLKEDDIYRKYLRANSYWYKKLIRDPSLFKEFKEEMRTNYKLRPIDKVNKTMDLVNVISNVFSNMV